MRLLNPTESQQLRLKLLSTWGVDGTLWAPLVEPRQDVKVLVFHAAYWNFRNGDAVLSDALARHGAECCFVLAEGEAGDREVEAQSVELGYDGTESYYTSDAVDWVAYASHEQSIAVAGEWLIQILEQKWPGCEMHGYRGPYDTSDLRGTEQIREIYRLQRDTPEAAYQALVRFATEECRNFSLVVRHGVDLGNGARRVLQSLVPVLRISQETDLWPGTVLCEGTALLHKGEMNSVAAGVLQVATNHLYGWEQPDLPEDLCFYRDDDTVFLASITHEKEAYFCLTPEERNKLLHCAPHLSITANPQPDHWLNVNHD